MNVPGFVLHAAASSKLDELSQKPPHAILLAGPEGSGKTHVARAFSMTLLGISSVENEAYFQEVAPKNGSITIEQVRNLAGFFRLAVPGKSAVKRVAVIQDADMLGLEAQNALLKLLEEPPIGSVLVLTSSNPDRLLATIRSRAQLTYLTAPEPAALQEHFAAAGHDKAAISSAILRANGNIALVEKILQDETSDDIVGLVKQALGGMTYERLLMVDGLLKQKDKGLEFVTTLAAVAAASLHAAAAKTAPSLTRWQEVLQAVHIAEEAYAQNGSPKLVLTELMLAL